MTNFIDKMINDPGIKFFAKEDITITASHITSITSLITASHITQT